MMLCNINDNELVINNRKFYVVDNEYRKHPDCEIILPSRGSVNSAGYDISIPVDIKILPNEYVLVWTDIKVSMNEDNVFKIYPRSSIGIKYNVILCNTVGIIDSDYFSNEKNDGNIGLCLYNYGNDVVNFKAGEKICQGIFQEYYITLDDNCDKVRVGGIGSTNEQNSIPSKRLKAKIVEYK